jgi:hypothetical protein
LLFFSLLDKQVELDYSPLLLLRAGISQVAHYFTANGFTLLSSGPHLLRVNFITRSKDTALTRQHATENNSIN